MKLKWNKEFALEQVGGDSSLLNECLKVFIQAANEDLYKMKRGILDGNFELVKRAAHSLKGAALNIGMNGIMELAKEIEDEALNENISKINYNIKKVEDLLNEILNET